MEDPSFPDDIGITVVHPKLEDSNRDEISNGIYIFLDNFLGEVNFATTIDQLNIEKAEGQKDLVPISKLKDYLLWRQKEFTGKYEGVHHDTQHDQYGILEGRTAMR